MTRDGRGHEPLSIIVGQHYRLVLGSGQLVANGRVVDWPIVTAMSSDYMGEATILPWGATFRPNLVDVRCPDGTALTVRVDQLRWLGDPPSSVEPVAGPMTMPTNCMREILALLHRVNAATDPEGVAWDAGVLLAELKTRGLCK